METYIHRNGEQFGPYTDEQLLEMLDADQIVKGDLIWDAGSEAWENAGDYILKRLKVAALPVLSHATQTPTRLPAGFARREEETFFDDGHITITKTRFAVGTQFYAIAGITSVRQGLKEPSKAGEVLVIIVGAMVILCSAGAFKGEGSWIGQVLCCGVGLFLVGGGIWSSFQKKPTYLVIISTAGGEVQACGSEDRGYSLTLIEALRQAIMARG
jgi:Family of unknown function (DUF6232)/GYF domain 2